MDDERRAALLRAVHLRVRLMPTFIKTKMQNHKRLVARKEAQPAIDKILKERKR